VDPSVVWAKGRVLGHDGAVIRDWVIRRTDWPDMGSVDEVARLRLLAVRLGAELVFDEMSDELNELLRLAGLVADYGD
jgi:hypothetical protein